MTVPFDLVIWNAQQCADYLGQSYSQFVKRTQHLEGFPRRCPIPGQPRWRAKAVAGWAIGSLPVHERASQAIDSVAQ